MTLYQLMTTVRLGGDIRIIVFDADDRSEKEYIIPHRDEYSAIAYTEYVVEKIPKFFADREVREVFAKDDYTQVELEPKHRLTKWNGKKWTLPQGQWREIAERLAAYENTGLEPEEVEQLIKK